MDRYGLRGLLIGTIGGCLIAGALYYEMEYIFPYPDNELGGFHLYLVLLGAMVGWCCCQFRSRACPACGEPMGHPHFPGGEGPGPILYQCPRCERITPYEEAVAAEQKPDGDRA